MMEAPSGNRGSAFCTVKSRPFTLMSKVESTLFLLDLCIETIEVAKIRHVSLYALYISADLLYRRSQLRLTSARDEGIGAFVDKRFCRSKANPAGPTSNECGFSFKLVHIFSS